MKCKRLNKYRMYKRGLALNYQDIETHGSKNMHFVIGIKTSLSKFEAFFHYIIVLKSKEKRKKFNNLFMLYIKYTNEIFV